MKKVLAGVAALVGVAWVGTVLAQQMQQAKPLAAVVDSRVLVPKTGAPAPSIKKPRTTAPAPAPVSAADKNALITAIQAGKPATLVTPPSRSVFTIGPDDLKVNGTLTGLNTPASVGPDGAAFEGSGSVANFGALDGAWLVDCSVNARGTNGAFTVHTGAFKDSYPNNVAQGNLPAVNGHILMGVYFSGGGRVGNLSDMKNGNLLAFYRSGEPFDWYSCTFTPVP